MPQVESRDNFIPTDHERRVLLELLQSPQESLESIAHELKITLAALTIYLATDDAATLFAQADLANARRARTAAAAHLEKCVGALALIIDDFVSDITHNLQRETPKSRREQDRQKETTRRAATVLYRIANFTPRTITAASHSPSPREGAGGWVPAAPVNATNTPQSHAAPLTNPTRQRGATDAPIAPPAPESQQLPSPPTSSPPTSALPALTSPERQRVGASAFTSAIPHPPSDIPPTSPERQRVGLPLTPLTISALSRPNRAPIPERRAPDVRPHRSHPIATVPP